MIVKQGTYSFVAEADSYGINSSANIEIGSATATAEFKSGTYKFNQTRIGKASNQTGTLKVSGGTFTSSSELYVGYSGPGYLEIDGGTVNAKYFIVGKGGTGYLEIDGGTVKATDNYSRIGAGGNGVVTIKSGSFDNSSASNKNLTLGQESGSSGTLNVEGGTFTVGGQIFLNYSENSVRSTINITGGTLAAGKIYLEHAGTSGGTVTIDGGTLKAYADNTSFLPAFSDATKFHVYAGANGATIDTGNHAITIGVVIEDKSGEAGKVTFKGGGTVTLSGTPTYTGDTTVDAGTVLKLGTAAKSAIFAHNVKVDVYEAPADGTEAIEITGDTISSEEFAKVSLVNNANDRYALELRDSDTKVVIVDKFAGEYVWSGTTGANWTTSGNWTKNGVAGNWYDSTAAVFAGAGDSATLDSDVTAASLTFRANATVAAGGGTLTVPSVSVVSDVSATINAPIAGALEKTGPGTLTLGASRSEATTLTEGTLVMSGSGTTLDWSKLTLGTDAAKPVTLVFTNDATLANQPLDVNFPTTANMTATIVKDSGDWNLTGKNFLLCGAAGTTAEFIHNGGTLTCGNYFVIGNNSSATSASMTINGGTVNCTKSADDYIAIGSHCPGSLTVKGANSAFNATANSLSVGRNKTGTLTVEDGGTVSVATDICLSRNSGGAGSSVTLKSDGTVVAERVRSNNAGTFVFDGGTLKARTTGKTLIDGSNNLAVSVTSNGGTVDSDGKTVTINAAISGTGGMTFTGGGIVTLAESSTYTGTTTVEVGTTVHIPSVDALTGGVAFTLPATTPEVNVYTPIVIDGDGTLPASILDNVERPEGVTNMRLSSDGKSVLCIYGDGGPVWIGGTSGSLSVASNWANGVVPGAGTNCVIGVSSAATLTVGSTFAASSITFPADSAVVTIGAAGDGTLSGITAITNLSTTANHVFNVALSGADNAAVVMNTQTYCVFNGGMTAYDVDFSQSPASDDARTFAGNWTLTTTADWTPAKNATVASGASLTVKNYSNNASDTLLINAGGVVTAEVAKVTGSSDGCLTRGINGTMVVTGECKMDSTGVNRFVAQETSTGTIIANKFSSTSTSIKYLLTNGSGFRHVVGAGGIAGTGWKGYANWNPVIACTNDFEITGTIEGYTSGTQNTYTLDTAGGYRVALASGGKLTGEKMALNVVGDGTFALAGGTADFKKGLTVNSGATLEVAQSGTVTLGGNLTLEADAALEFSPSGVTDSTLAIASGKTLSLPESGTVTVKFASKALVKPGQSYTILAGAGLADASKFALESGDGGTLSVSGGDLVYTAPRYFMIRVADGDAEESIPVAWDWIVENGYGTLADTEAAVSTAIAGSAANGLPAWQCYCLGLDPEDAASRIYCAKSADQTGVEAGSVRVAAANLNVPENPELAVSASLERSADLVNWEIADGPDEVPSGSVEFIATISENASVSYFRISAHIAAASGS